MKDFIHSNMRGNISLWLSTKWKRLYTPFSLIASKSLFFASSLSLPSGFVIVNRQAASSRLGFFGKPSSSRFSTGIIISYNFSKEVSKKMSSSIFWRMSVTWPRVLSGLAWGLQASQLGWVGRKVGRQRRKKKPLRPRSLTKEISLKISFKPIGVGTLIVKWTDLG